MKKSAQEICNLVQGELHGDPNLMVTGPSKIDEGLPGTISFLGNQKYENYLYNTQASLVLVDAKFCPKSEVNVSLIKVDDVYTALSKILNLFESNKSRPDAGISTLSVIRNSTDIDPTVSIAPFCNIGNVSIGKGSIIHSHVCIEDGCKIGANVIIFPGVRIYHNVTIGDNVIIHANAVLGSDGFGFSKKEDNSYDKLKQLGTVIIENDVEIGANTVIDRASIGATIIREGVKLDNLIQVAHNVEIGKNTVMAAQVGVAGSTKIGANCMIGGQVGFIGHLKIADGAQIQAQSGVAGSVKKENAKLYGYPAIDYGTYLRAFAQLKHLPEMAKKLRALEKELASLKKQSAE